MPKRNRNKKRAQIGIPGSSTMPSTFPNPFFSTPTISVLPGSSSSTQGQGRRLGSSAASDLHSPLISQLRDARISNLGLPSAAATAIGTSRPTFQNPGLFPVFAGAGVGNTPLFQRPTPTTTSVNRNDNNNTNNNNNVYSYSPNNTTTFNRNGNSNLHNPSNTTTFANRNSNSNVINSSNTDTSPHTFSQTNTTTNTSTNLLNLLLNPQPTNAPSISIDRTTAVSAGPSTANRVPPPAPRNASRTTWPNLSSDKENTPVRSANNIDGAESSNTYASVASFWNTGATTPSAYPRLTRTNSGWEPVTQPRPVARDDNGSYLRNTQRVSSGESTTSAPNPIFPAHPTVPHLAGDGWNFPFRAGVNHPSTGPSHISWQEPSTTTNPHLPQEMGLFDNLGIQFDYETSARLSLYSGSGMFQGSSRASVGNPWANTRFLDYNATASEDEFDETISLPSSAHPESPCSTGLAPRPFTTQEINNNPIPENVTQDEASSGRRDISLRELAEEASVLLEVYSRTTPGENENENYEMIKSIFKNVSKIWDKYKPTVDEEQVFEGKGKQKAVEIPAADDACVIDAACIVCCAEVADVVLVPCNHLILCSGCCDVMEIHKQDSFMGIGEKKLCPLCRATVHGRIKVFRG